MTMIITLGDGDWPRVTGTASGDCGGALYRALRLAPPSSTGWRGEERVPLNPEPNSPAKACFGPTRYAYRGWGRYPLPTIQSAQPMPSHYLPDGKCRLQWHL